MDADLVSYTLLTERTRNDESYDDWLKDVKRLSMHYNDDFTEHEKQMLKTLYNCYSTTHDGAMYLLGFLHE